MKKTTKSVERLQDMLKHGNRKRKRSSSPDDLPPAKRSRVTNIESDITTPSAADILPPEVRPSLSEEALEGIRAAEKLIEEITKELAAYVPTRRGLITRLSDNSQAENIVEVKVVPVKRRGGWRRKGDKRL